MTKENAGDDDSSFGFHVEEHITVYIFLFYIKKTIELVTDGDSKLEIFPMQPQCFMLTDTYKEEIIHGCDGIDSNQKMTELLNSFQVINITMDAYLQ